MDHVVVTVVRDEEEFVSDLIESMADQTYLPKKWIFVDNFSEDGTREIIRKAISKYEWIELIEQKGSRDRSRGENIAKLFRIGIESCKEEWKFCSKIDADMVLPQDYFAEIFQYFVNNEDLGIASGSCFLEIGGKREIERVSLDHTRGGLKTYRLECFNSIGGIPPVDGWDGIDNAKAQMGGWKTRNFPIPVLHRRETGAHRGRLASSFEVGTRCHFIGYSFIFLIVKVAHYGLVIRRPISAISMFLGYTWSVILRKKKYAETDVVRFIRKRKLELIKEAIIRKGR